jgi:hypothetical protein
MTLQQELRQVASDIRSGRLIAHDFVTLLERSAARIDQDEKDIAQLQMDASFTKAEQFCAGVFNKN